MGKEKFGSNKQTTAEILREIVGGFFKGEEFYNSLGIVKAVDSIEKTCSVQVVNGDLIPDVRLQQVASDEGLFISPKINSSVVVGWTDKTTAYLAVYSEIDSIVFQNGENGGLIKIVEQTAKINELVTKYNDLVNRLLAWTPVIGDGGTALKTALTLPTPISTNPALDKADFENENFKH